MFMHGLKPGPALWCAGLLLAVDQIATAGYINSLMTQGASLETLFQEVFEPAARFLGGLAAEIKGAEVSIVPAMAGGL